MSKKVYTVSLSPAIDYIIKVDNLVKGKTNRPFETDIYPAGKGIHVSMMLNNLGIKNKAIIFSSGEFENFFYSGLKKINVNYKKFEAVSNIRINVKLIDKDQTEFSAQTSQIKPRQLNLMKEYFGKELVEGDIVVFSGSIPKNTSETIYGELVELVTKKQCLSVVDSFGVPLLKAIDQKPFLIKPNIEELSLTYNKKLGNFNDLRDLILKIICTGVENVLVSMGKDGAALFTKERIYKCSIPTVGLELVNAAGAGDSMVAGFIYKYLETNNPLESLKFSIITGCATAFSNRIADIEMINEILKYEKTINVESLNW
ncbi:1-phosphofructokinase family hexose kinase [Spiroplasma endosymbiont of Aspidapion aeneum]|uniref:1-phosphofructokinase family hexose kinase n=1 Tax=Spiroplasma endosymbiont of Aspidapion aeneum TaxID=3066276 RepID=UPI00313CDBD9